MQKLFLTVTNLAAEIRQPQIVMSVAVIHIAFNRSIKPPQKHKNHNQRIDKENYAEDYKQRADGSFSAPVEILSFRHRFPL